MVPGKQPQTASTNEVTRPGNFASGGALASYGRTINAGYFPGRAFLRIAWVGMLTLLLALPLAAQAQSAANGLEVVAQGGVERDTNAMIMTGRRSFGTLDPLQTVTVEQVFTLRNAGSAPLVIDRLQPTCGCSSAFITDTTRGDRPFLASGEQISVRVSVELAHLQPGAFIKYVQVYIQGHATPVVVLEMAGTLKDLVQFSPSTLDFGTTVAGKSRILEVKTTVDPRLFDKADPLRLVSSDPDILVEPLASPTPEGSVASTAPVVRVYRLSLSPQARLGPVQGTVCLIKVAGTPSRSDYETLALAGRLIPVTGIVTGDITSLPHAVVFGSIAQGTANSERVLLIENTPGALDGITVTCDNSYLILRLGARTTASPRDTPGHTVTQPTRTLEVSVSRKAPPGGYQPEITVTTKSGQHLTLTVYLNILSIRTR